MNVRNIACVVIMLLAGVAWAAPQQVVNAEEAIEASGWHATTVELKAQAPVQLAVQGLRHVDKGFTVYVMTPDDFAHFQRREMFHHVEAFHGLKVRSLTQTATLPPGKWVFVVHNSENWLRTMIVRVRVVVDPV